MTSHSQGVDAELAAIMEGDLGEMLRHQLAASNPDFDKREINDALQAACDLAIRKDCHATSTGETYAWLRTTAHRWLGEQRRLRQREIPTDPEAPVFHRPDESASAETEVLRAERHQDQATIAGSIVAGLSARQRDVLALHVHGHRRPAVAAALGMTPRQVKRELEAIMRSARSIAGRLLGGGCDQGETIVLRRSCGLAKGREARRAASHLAGCDRCRALADRLDLMRDAPALLPAPAVADQATTGVAADAVSGVRQHLADGAAYVKQQAANAYYRVTDPTPLAGTRPGAMAAVVAGCVTLGTSTYCVSNNVNPLTSIGLLTPALPDKPPPETKVERVKATPPAPEPVSDPTPAPEVKAGPDPAPVQPVESDPAPAPEPEPAPEPATPAPVPASGGDSLSGLSGNPTPEPAPAPPPPPTVGGGTGSSGTDFGGL
ncbi:MAG: hypothetical protein GXY03_02520 [Solirubrobacterales bacterium]|nr:hypothetical protein [Solirubrobacterales bacterium]